MTQRSAGARPTRAKPARAWQRMLSGRRLDLLDPTPVDVEIEDIAHGLARVARWNGQTVGEWPFSVADHSLLVEDLCGRLRPSISAEDRLIALLHDAPEYVIGDLISPFKAVVGDGYKSLEHRLLCVIFIRFGLPASPATNLMKLVKRADILSAYLEAIRLAGFSEEDAVKAFGAPTDERLLTIELPNRTPSEAKAAFIDRFETLSAAMDAERGAP
ncbi:MAG: HD family hydrolase [Neomegalonema sp.]|nr:HD family hydrolase [Neomegalonema sp.]